MALTTKSRSQSWPTMADNSLLDRLRGLPNKIRVAIVGCGAMGKGVFYQCCVTPGMECVAIADVKVERAVACARWMGREYEIVGSLNRMHDVIRHGRIAVAEDGLLAAACEPVDVLVECSSSIEAAGRFAVAALEHDKHLILMNAEADLIFGPYFMRLAKERGVVATSCDGDQPAVIARLVNDLSLWGLDLVMAGNVKGFLDRYSNPTAIVPEAEKRNLDYRMATAYTDGTKLCVEMALVANAYGLEVSVPGMQGPKADHVSDVLGLFDFDKLWRDRRAVVDYVIGAEPGGGVFAVGFCDGEYQKSMLSYYKMGQGPFYVFYRPYHLCHIEAVASIAEAFLDRRALVQPRYGFRTNVYTYAKRDLRKGERLDGIGGYTCYGLIDNCALESNPPLPICLAEDLVLRADVARDARILMDDVVYDPDRFDFGLYVKATSVAGLGMP